MSRYNISYLTGVYLAINAISDAYLLMDSPNCCYKKMEYIDKNHDLFSDIFRNNGYHRIAHTGVSVKKIAYDRTKGIKDFIQKINDYPQAKSIFVSAMPMASLTGIQYESIIDEIQKNIDKPIIYIPSGNISYDWLSGYENSLIAIAQSLNLTNKKRTKNKVAIIGYLMDRNEGDHHGNLLQLEKYLKALELDLSSVWLNGKEFNQLAKVENAQLLISLPYARKTAQLISQKTGSDILELDLPFGFGQTSNWLLQIAKYFNKTKQARKLIDSELKQTAGMLEYIVPNFILNEKISIVADPFLGKALTEGLQEVGARINNLILFAKKNKKLDLANYSVENIHYISDLAEDLDFIDTDILIGNSEVHEEFRLSPKPLPKPYLQLGFPSHGYHCLYNNPYLGYKGFVIFINRLVNAVNSFYVNK